MAIKFQYNKTSLQQLEKQLKVRVRTLPIIKNKEMIYLIQRYKKEKQLKKAKEAEMSNGIKFTGEGMEPTTFSQI